MMEAVKSENLSLNSEEELIVQSIQSEPKLLIVTGFGVFEGHEEVNASWEAVRRLPDSLNCLETNYVIEKVEVPVEYEAVDKIVEQIWARKPELVIHCGVHGAAENIYIEKLAYNHKFCRPDYAGKRLKRSSACLKNCHGIQNDVKLTHFNVEKICSAACDLEEDLDDESRKQCKAIATISKNVGNYLCGYIYLKSLDFDNLRTLFVHVPPVDKPLSSNTVSAALLNIIKECLRQLLEEFGDHHREDAPVSNFQ